MIGQLRQEDHSFEPKQTRKTLNSVTVKNNKLRVNREHFEESQLTGTQDSWGTPTEVEHRWGTKEAAEVWTVALTGNDVPRGRTGDPQAQVR